MATPALVLQEPRPSWGVHAHAGRWGDRAIVALLGPRIEGAAERSRARAEAWIGRTGDRIHPLLGVVPHEGRAAWIYPDADAIALGCVVLRDPPPIRVAALLAAEVAECLVELADDGTEHPGPSPDDVLLFADGRVALLGFVGPTLPEPGRRDPGGAPDTREAVVYRLGCLLVELLTGTTPPATSGEDAHAAMLRRVLIRVMSRPGPVFPDRYRDWLSGMLARVPTERPPLPRVPPGLRALAAPLPGSDIVTWAAREVPVRRDDKTPLQAPEPVVGRGVRRATVQPEAPTLESDHTEIVGDTVVDDLGHDDATAISEVGSPPVARRTPPPLPRGAIPVQVGPPVEVARRRPSIPSDLFTDSTPLQPPPEPPPREDLPDWLPTGSTLAAIAAGMSAIAVLLAIYLFL